MYELYSTLHCEVWLFSTPSDPFVPIGLTEVSLKHPPAVIHTWPKCTITQTVNFHQNVE